MAKQLAALSKGDRKALARLGVAIGAQSVRLTELPSGPEGLRLRALLWCLGQGKPLPTSLPDGARCFAVEAGTPDALALALGFRVLRGKDGQRAAVRADVLEGFWQACRGLAAQGPFQPTARLAQRLGAGRDLLRTVLEGLGFTAQEGEGGPSYRRAGRARQSAGKRGSRQPKRPSDSPFAVLDGVVPSTGSDPQRRPRRRGRR